MGRRRLLIWSIVVVVGLVVAGVASYFSFTAGQRSGHGTRHIEGTITLVNYDHTEGCVTLDHGGQVCGAFVGTTPSNNLLTKGTRVIGGTTRVKVNWDYRTVLIIDRVSALDQ